MRYLITGSRGFAATHLVERLLRNDENFVVGLDCLYGCASRHDPPNANANNYVFVEGNLNNKELVFILLNNYQFDFVLHLSAQSHIDTSFSDPYKYALDNFNATLTLLESIKKMPIELRPKIIHCSTDEVLGPSTDEKAKDVDSLLLPTNVYSATKSGAECLCNAYKKSHKLDIIIVRPNNLIGEGQYQEKVVGRFTSLLKKDEPITIHGSGEQLRAFLYISDFCSAIELLIAKGTWGKIYHISSDYEISVLDLAKKIAKTMNKEETYKIRFVQDRAFNDVRYHIDSTALKALGWTQTVDLQEAISRTVKWYILNNDKDYFMEDFEIPVQKDI